MSESSRSTITLPRPGSAPTRSRGEPGSSAAVRRLDWALVAVAGLTAIALALRLVLMRDSLEGDELFMFAIVHGHSFGQAMHIVRETEKTPPLFFIFTWLSIKIGDPTYWIRLPTVVFGTALVPLSYALGRRTVGKEAGVIGAAILALGSYSIFYGTEARAYAALAFFSALSTLCLLEAVRTRRRAWWAGYGLVVLATMYTHYMGIFVVLVQAAWALWTHREQLRVQLVVYSLCVLAYIPWLPSFLLQEKHSANEAERIAAVAPDTVSRFADLNARVLFGNPFVSLRDLPGTGFFVLGLVLLGVALVAAIARVWSRRGAGLQLSSPITLIALLAVASPLGVFLISLRPGESFMLPRNFIASLVPLALIVAWLLRSLPRRVAPVAIAAFLLVMTVGAIDSLNRSNRRSPWRQVAQFINARARPGDPVVQELIVYTNNPPDDALRVNLSARNPVYLHAAGQAHAWKLGMEGRRVFYTIQLPGFWKRAKEVSKFAGPGNRFVRVAQAHYKGALSDAIVGEYVLANRR